MPKAAGHATRDDETTNGRPQADHADGTRKRGAFALRVLAIRHAVAEDRADFARTGEPDGLRPLTRQGRRRMRRAARGLAAVVPKVDVLASSPLTRAVQTAEIVARRYERAKQHRLPSLAPGKPMNALLGWLAQHPPGRTVAIVGHEPHLGEFVSWALTGLRESFVPLKKGAACLIEFPGEVKPGRATLLWLMKPSQMRAIGR